MPEDDDGKSSEATTKEAKAEVQSIMPSMQPDTVSQSVYAAVVGEVDGVKTVAYVKARPKPKS